MSSKLKAFMFNTPLTYTELRALKHIQTLKHVESPHAEQQVKVAQQQEHHPNIRVSVSQLSEWRHRSPFYFAGVGAGLGLVVGIFKALKYPLTRIYDDKDSGLEYQLDLFGPWSKKVDLPYGGYDLKTFKDAHVIEKLSVRQRHRSLWDALNASPATYAHVVRRAYQENRFIDTDVHERPGGGMQVSRQLKNKQGVFPQFEARLNSQGELQSLTHYIHHQTHQKKLELTPVTHQKSRALVTHDNRADYTFFLNDHARTHVMEVAHPDTQLKYRVQSEVENVGQFHQTPTLATAEATAKVAIFRGDTAIKWQALTPEEQTLINHPLFFRQLLPDDHDRNLLNLVEHIPPPLRGSSFRQDVSQGFRRLIPWKDWLGKPFAYVAVFSGLAVLTQQFILSHQSPFSRWLNEHVQLRRNEEAPFIQSQLDHPKKMLYVKDTGNESADASIGKALRILSNFGLIKASVVHKEKKTPQPREIAHTPNESTPAQP